jgi:hypothetical protein
MLLVEEEEIVEKFDVLMKILIVVDCCLFLMDLVTAGLKKKYLELVINESI